MAPTSFADLFSCTEFAQTQYASEHVVFGTGGVDIQAAAMCQ